MSAKTPRPDGVDADELLGFCSSLEEVTQAANGYGSLQSAAIETELSGAKVVATYDGTSWSVSIKEGR